jgi:hypothetical protein
MSDYPEMKRRREENSFSRSMSKRGIRLPSPMEDFENAPYEGRVEYGGFGQYYIHITHGVFRYGPEGGPFMAFTYKGAKRKMERILRERRKTQARALGLREVQLDSRSDWEREFDRLSS